MTKLFCEYLKPSVIPTVVALVVSVFVAMGFRMTTPASAITTLERRMVVVEQNYQSDHQLLVSLARLECLRSPAEMTALAGLDCRTLLNR